MGHRRIRVIEEPHRIQLSSAEYRPSTALAHMTGSAVTAQGEQPVAGSADDSPTQGLLRRADLVAKLDQALTRKVTIIAAPPGSGKTSLLRTWSERTGEDVRVAFVSVQRDQRDAPQF